MNVLELGPRVGGYQPCSLPDTRAAISRSFRRRRRHPKTACHTAGTSSVDSLVQRGLVFPLGTPDAWDAKGVGNPVVRCYIGDDEQRWYMWYNGFSEASASSDPPQPSCIGIAISDDGLHWHRGNQEVAGCQGPAQLRDVGRVLTPNPDWWWHDTRHVSVSDVQMFSSDAVNTGVGVYWMFYTGGSFEPVPTPAGLPGLPEGQELEGLRTRVGLAMSQDGRNWARIEANHHSGALFDAGTEEEWDSALNGHPQVLALGPGKMRMYYHSFSPKKQKWVIGYATSHDGFNWKKEGPIFEGGEDSDFDAKGAASHCVVQDVDSGRFVMFYEAVGADESRSISIAVSEDGLTQWRRLGQPVLSSGPQDAWDSAAVGAPCAVSMADGRWRLYYCGREDQGGQWTGIGLAITDAENTDSFEGVRTGFKRRMPRPK